MRTSSIVPTTPSETLTSRWTPDDGGAPMSDKALRIIGCDTGPGGDHCAHGFRSTAATLLKGGRVRQQCGGSRTRALHGEKSAGAPTRWRRQLDKGDKNKTRGIYSRAAYCAERVRQCSIGLIATTTCATVPSPSRYADRRPG
jgi:hypothetical protein